MLEEVRITGLGVINDALLELSPGFTALTGETGAGKTMVVTGLGLLFGGRADPSRVRPDAQRASVEGRLRTDPRGKVAQQVEEAGGDLDEDGTLVLTRTVSGEGRSRAFAGGRSVPVSLLTYLADDLVAVHGQADQQQLLKPGRQRESLDKYAGGVLAAVVADYQRAYGRHRAVAAELTTLTTEARARAAEAEELRAGLADIEKLSPRKSSSSTAADPFSDSLPSALIVVHLFRKKRNRNALGNRHHLQRGQDLLRHLHRAKSTRDSAIADETRRFVSPLARQIVERVEQRRRHAVVVFRGHERKGIGGSDGRAPCLGMRVLILVKARMLGFIEDRQCDLFQVDEGGLELTMALYALDEPIGNRATLASFACAAKNNVEFRENRLPSQRRNVEDRRRRQAAFRKIQR